ncbi:MAG TPA: TIR domain-containing protein [Pilimelia sp.]|nr:TIR domain-containing protein [Pilimelia sp.]
MTAQWDVFISYARSGDGDDARLVHETLAAAGISSFLDERAIPLDAKFQQDLATALLGARLFLVFASPAYFQRRWCIYEFQVAIAPARVDPSDPLDHVVVALCGDDPNQIVRHLPPTLAQSNLSGADPSAVLERVRDRLRTVRTSIGERLRGVDDYAVRTLRHGGAVPAATSLVDLPGRRGAMPNSLTHALRGRDVELWTVFHELVTVGVTGPPRSCYVHGAPGTGKSQLAAEFIWRYAAESFPGGVVWIDAGGSGTELDEQLRAGVAALAAAREAAGPGRALWVVDGIPPPPASRRDPPLRTWCPMRGDVTLLCTGRRRRLLDVDVTVELRPLTESAAVDLLTQAPVDRSGLRDDEWGSIARRVGFLPQALRILYAMLASDFRTPAELLAQARTADPVPMLETHWSELSEEIPEGALRGVAETFATWYENLAANRELRSAAHLLARTGVNPVSAKLVPRQQLAQLAHRSWLQTVEPEKPRGTPREPGRPQETVWRLNDLVASYLRGVSPDPAAECVRLACYYLGFEGGQRTTMAGMPRGGLDVLAGTRFAGAQRLEELAEPLLRRALENPDDHDAAHAAEVLGALWNEEALRSLARALEAADVSNWRVSLYLRYVQGFYHAPLEIDLPTRVDDRTAVVDAESLLPRRPSRDQTARLFQPLLQVLRRAPEKVAAFAAYQAATPEETRDYLGQILVQLAGADGLPAKRLQTLALAALAANEQLAWGWAALGTADRTLGDHDAAVRAFQTAVEIDPKLAWAHQRLGELHLKTEPARAVEHFDAAISLGLTSMTVLMGKTVSLISLRRWNEAVTTADAAIELNKAEPLAWFARAKARIAMGDVQAGVTDLAEVFRLDPGNQAAREFLRSLGVGGPETTS